MEDGHQPQLLLSLVSISRHSPTKGLEDQIRLARGGCRSEGPSPEVDTLPSRILMAEKLALGPHRSNHVLQRKLKQAAGGVSVTRAPLLPAPNPEELLLLLQS